MKKQLLTLVLHFFIVTNICTQELQENSIPIEIHVFQVKDKKMVEDAFLQREYNIDRNFQQQVYHFKNKEDRDQMFLVINATNAADLICKPFLVAAENKTAKVKFGQNKGQTEESFFNLEITPSVDHETITYNIMCDIQNEHNVLKLDVVIRTGSKAFVICEDNFIIFISSNGI